MTLGNSHNFSVPHFFNNSTYLIDCFEDLMSSLCVKCLEKCLAHNKCYMCVCYYYPLEHSLSFLGAPDAKTAILLRVFQMSRYSCLVVPQLPALPGLGPQVDGMGSGPHHHQASAPLSSLDTSHLAMPTWAATAGTSRNRTSSLLCPALPAARESMQSPKSS